MDKQTGRGPAWGNSLFEDNSKYGLGIVLSMNHRRATLTEFVENAVKTKVGSTEIQEALAECLERNQDSRLRGLW